MPKELTWTAAIDTRLKRRRAQGASWAAIAAELGIGRNLACERGRHIGARLPARKPLPPAGEVEPDPTRLPLPAGHPFSWDVLVAGTSLDGQPYESPHQRTPRRVANLISATSSIQGFSA